jgi:hypothetical protein
MGGDGACCAGGQSAGELEGPVARLPRNNWEIPMSHFRDLIGQDVPVGNDGDTPGYTSPVSSGEIEELLYNEEWSAEDRIARLREMRAQLAELEGPDYGDDDPLTLIRQIDDAVARLRNLEGEGMDPTGIDMDPASHRETLSPDSDELLDLEEEDEESLTDGEETDEDSIDKREWIEGLDLDDEKS